MINPKWWYSEYFKVLWKMMKKFFYDVPRFGIKIAHYNFWWEFANSSLLPFNLNKKVKLKRHKLISNFLSTKYSDFINKYKNIKIEIWRNARKIWVLWWQWIESAPELVKICVNSIKEHNCWYEVILLTRDNYENYIKLPEFILQKVKKKEISITHLSDIIRMALLKEYWGIWIDATMFICSDVFKSFDNINLNTNYPVKFVQERWWFEKWCGFLFDENQIDYFLLYMIFLCNTIKIILMW